MNTTETHFDFGKVKIQDDIVVAEMKEGVTIDINYTIELLQFCKNQFKEKTYGYISNRVNSYSVNPTVYLYTAKNSNVRAIAIVSADPIHRKNAAIERQFFQYPFEVFATLEEATAWIDKVLAN